MNEKKQAPAPPPPVLMFHHHPDTHTRWTWVRRFIVSLFILAVIIRCTAPKTRLSQLWEATSSTRNGQQQQQPKIVLHTGFPVPEALTGQTILPNHAAALAFLPTTISEEKSATTVLVKRRKGEGWWDRIFPWRHVHLHSVQLAVTAQGQLNHVRSTLSICISARDDLRQNIPDIQKCVASFTSTIILDPSEEGQQPKMPPLGIVEWVPEEAIVLKKNQLYWLVVQAAPGTDGFDWVFAQVSGGVVGDRGLAYESDAGWQLQDADGDTQPIPSVMITVAAHK